jgi:hypothetical protein
MASTHVSGRSLQEAIDVKGPLSVAAYGNWASHWLKA